MRQRIDYIILGVYMFFESLLWTLTDLVRAGRMRHTKRMHARYKPPVYDPDQSEADIKNQGQNNQ